MASFYCTQNRPLFDMRNDYFASATTTYARINVHPTHARTARAYIQTHAPTHCRTILYPHQTPSRLCAQFRYIRWHLYTRAESTQIFFPIYLRFNFYERMCVYVCLCTLTTCERMFTLVGYIRCTRALTLV